MSNAALTSRRRSILAALLVLGVCTGMAVFVWYSLRQQIEDAATQQFELLSFEIAADIRERMRQHEQILLGGAGLFDASGALTREAWRDYVARLNLAKNYPGIQGVGFSKVIAPVELEAHIAAVRMEGFSDYVVRPPGARELYTSIIYLEPFEGRNLAAFGFDMFSEATRNRAMRLAVDGAGTTISAKVKLVQETHGKPQAGFLMYVPVYRHRAPQTTPEERWQALAGFVYSPYRVSDLMRGVLGSRNTSVLDFTIHDGSEINADTLMYDSAEEHAADPAGGARFTASHHIATYGHDWTIGLRSRPAFEAQFHSPFEWVVLILGILIGSALAALTWSLSDRRERALGLANDMTLQFREVAAHTQAIVDNVIDGIVTIDERGIVGSLNRSAERIFGYMAGEVISRNVSMLMPEPYRSQHDAYLHSYLTTGTARIIGIGREVVGLRKDGGSFPMELSVSELHHGGQRMFIGVVRDLTDRKQSERMKSEFVSTVSHELRTPLTAIAGALGLLAGGALGALPEQAKGLLDIALANSQRLTSLVNDLLDMEKIAAGKLQFDMRAHLLDALVAQAVSANQSYAIQHQVRCVVTAQAGDALVWADSARLLQVLSNLLSNAAKFSPAGGTVEIAAQRSAERVRVSVRDHGPGVPAAFRDRIFLKFSQADSSDTRLKGGTGLGLAISKELIEHMGGSIGFDSVEGQGASFFFELPNYNDHSVGKHEVG
jgi:PAS domain S-box-containing protein